MIKNIAYIVSGLAGIIFGCTLLNNGLLMAIGGGGVLIICGAYIAFSGIRNIVKGEDSSDTEEQKSEPTYPSKKKKKKNPRKKK